jgi:hypothetical protein
MDNLITEENALWEFSKNLCKFCDIFGLCHDRQREMISILENCSEVNLRKICDVFGIYTLETSTKLEIIDCILKEDISPSNVIEFIECSKKCKYIRICHAKKLKKKCECIYTKDDFNYEYRSTQCRKYQNHSVFMYKISSTWLLNEKNGKFRSDTSRFCDLCQDKHKIQGFIIEF